MKAVPQKSGSLAKEGAIPFQELRPLYRKLNFKINLKDMNVFCLYCSCFAEEHFKDPIA